MHRHNKNSTPIPPQVHQVGSLITHQSVNTASAISVGAIRFEGGWRPVVVELLGFLSKGFVLVLVGELELAGSGSVVIVVGEERSGWVQS